MGALARRFFSESPVLGFAIIALVLFIATFTAIVVGICRKEKTELDELSELPLQEEKHSDV